MNAGLELHRSMIPTLKVYRAAIHFHQIAISSPAGQIRHSLSLLGGEAPPVKAADPSSKREQL